MTKLNFNIKSLFPLYGNFCSLFFYRLSLTILFLFFSVALNAQETHFDNLKQTQETIRIAGKVVDGKLEPIIGARIKILGFNKETFSDVDGIFNFDVPPEATIEISFIGFIKQFIKISEKKDFPITLVESIEPLDPLTRTIDASKGFRQFPDLVAYRNTSIQKAPAPVLGKLSEDLFGKAKITRCWLNLDEMWDYRTRQFDFNFKIGVDKYKGISEKYRESWDWEVESPITFYEYMESFCKHSDNIMLTIRRYERDILDEKLPIKKEDWKMIFKAGLKHYKKLYPNIRYIEVCNEYPGFEFMHATNEEYYQFYKLGYEAVNEINEELKLKGDDRLLVGGPVVNVYVLKLLDRFFESFYKDKSNAKKLDFISWHDYDVPINESVVREKEIITLLKKYQLNESLPLFMTEHHPFHFNKGFPEYHFINAAYLPKSLYFSSLISDRVKIFPWVLYHNQDIQTRFMWFDGPNKADTKQSEIRMLPLGCSMKYLSMLKGIEIMIDNSIEGNDLVISAFEKDRLIVEAINYGASRNVSLNINKLQNVFPELKNGKLHIVKYLIDSKHSNYLSNPEYPGGIEKIQDSWIKIRNGEITLTHSGFEKNGMLLWEIKR